MSRKILLLLCVVASLMVGSASAELLPSDVPWGPILPWCAGSGTPDDPYVFGVGINEIGVLDTCYGDLPNDPENYCSDVSYRYYTTVPNAELTVGAEKGVYECYYCGEVARHYRAYTVNFASPTSGEFSVVKYNPAAGLKAEVYRCSYEVRAGYVPAPDLDVVIRAIDSITGAALSDWTLDYVANSSGVHVVGSTAVTGSSVTVALPAAFNYEYRVHCSKTGYEQSPGLLQFNVPESGATVTVQMRPLAPVVNPDYGAVRARIVNSDTSAGLYGASLHVGSYSSFSGSDGVAWVSLPPGDYAWGVIMDGYHPTGGYVTVQSNQTVDLGTVYTVRKTSPSNPPPTLPPEFPADIPDPADIPTFNASERWRWTIEQNNSLVAQFAAPFLNMLDGLAVSVNAFVLDAFHLLLGPVASVVGLVSDGAGYLETSLAAMIAYAAPIAALLKVAIACIPDKVVALGTFALGLNLVAFVLRGPI